MYEVQERDMPERALLCLKRHVSGEEAAWDLGKEFIELLKQHELPRIAGDAGAVFCVYWGEITGDGDGPLEWCRPIPPEAAMEASKRAPELTVRTEPAHREAFVHLGESAQLSAEQWAVITDSLADWIKARGQRPIGLGMRVTYLSEPMMAASRPDCDFALPVKGG